MICITWVSGVYRPMRETREIVFGKLFDKSLREIQLRDHVRLVLTHRALNPSIPKNSQRVRWDWNRQWLGLSESCTSFCGPLGAKHILMILRCFVSCIQILWPILKHISSSWVPKLKYLWLAHSSVSETLRQELPRHVSSVPGHQWWGLQMPTFATCPLDLQLSQPPLPPTSSCLPSACSQWL